MIVKKYELELLTKEVRKNSSRLNELLDDSFIEFAQDGKSYTKKQIIDILPQCPEETIEIINYIERKLSENLILVNYEINREVITYILLYVVQFGKEKIKFGKGFFSNELKNKKTPISVFLF